ncbi:unnamed protein product [Adineta steineri]|uniref:G-protein coupled receptors family 1 profile domain-containing protein n=1 Tax=Adineta steineri TaxID=433720 RepID=A0A814CLC7_9BILA|nr:unnamed protein product [Adineta steineri]CAF0854329.1 unnamed protein product [Adineta steineri]CAF0946168.1 unnamed protein product [Adineta steineri]
MTMEYEDSSSTLEKLTLLVFIVAIVIGNLCVFITYLVRADGKHWSNVFVLCMAFIDLFIGGFVLPMRFMSAYGSPLTSKLCTALAIGESCALAAIIYAIAFMIYTRLYSLKQPTPVIDRRFLLILILLSWVILFLFYGIPFMTNYSNYLLTETSTTSNQTSYCTTYTTSIYHPLWMAYTEIGIIYILPLLIIFIGLLFLMKHLCKRRPRRLEASERKSYIEQQQMTWHVYLLGITFCLFWFPWIIIRIIIIFNHTYQIQRALQITYYILMIKSFIFPILYAATNASFRGNFAIYRHQRIVINKHIWSVNDSNQQSLQQRRGY